MADEVVKCLPQAGSFGSMSAIELTGYADNAAEMSRRASKSLDPLAGCLNAAQSTTRQLKAGARVVHASKRPDQVAKYVGTVAGTNLHTIEYSDGVQIKAKLSNLTVL